jgi:hypothetical protein
MQTIKQIKVFRVKGESLLLNKKSLCPICCHSICKPQTHRKKKSFSLSVYRGMNYGIAFGFLWILIYHKTLFL